MERTKIARKKKDIEPQPAIALRPFEEIKALAKNQLEQLCLHQGRNQKDVLRRANDTLSKTINQATELVEMVDHSRLMTLSKKTSARKIATSVMTDLVNQILHAMQYTFPLGKITVLKIIPNDLPPVPVPPEHLETILFHLIYHARQVIGDNVGIITIEGREKQRPGGGGTADRYFDIRVSYLTSEIPVLDFTHLFDPFYDTANPDSSGRFGLFIAKKLIEHHHGTIQVNASLQTIAFQMEFPGS
ncbi:MAG: hypothetical protein PHN49_06400 [Candidatus Omnitrophica bacterium]|nr:hypothetical protein [Candidatus Omnitrophota bacterium]MDD5671249.1 hypothetical protein [Candidatus Omnitrophota bacterium]